MEQVERALHAGAEFIVSPGFDSEIVDYCLVNHIPVLPGCVTPTEVIRAVKRGMHVVKFFPAEQYGGVDTIRALASAFPGLRFMPTGGIGPSNLKEYLRCDKVFACGGSWMVKKELIAAGNFDRIRELTRGGGADCLACQGVRGMEKMYDLLTLGEGAAAAVASVGPASFQNSEFPVACGRRGAECGGGRRSAGAENRHDHPAARQ